LPLAAIGLTAAATSLNSDDTKKRLRSTAAADSGSVAKETGRSRTDVDLSFVPFGTAIAKADSAGIKYRKPTRPNPGRRHEKPWNP